MFELTALAVTGVAAACRHQALVPGRDIEITWRHYPYDPDGLWFLEVDIASPGGLERTTALVR